MVWDVTFPTGAVPGVQCTVALVTPADTARTLVACCGAPTVNCSCVASLRAIPSPGASSTRWEASVMSQSMPLARFGTRKAGGVATSVAIVEWTPQDPSIQTASSLPSTSGGQVQDTVARPSSLTGITDCGDAGKEAAAVATSVAIAAPWRMITSVASTVAEKGCVRFTAWVDSCWCTACLCSHLCRGLPLRMTGTMVTTASAMPSGSTNSSTSNDMYTVCIMTS